MIHCGDLSQCGDLEDYRNTLKLLEKIPAPLKLVIPGNHDLSLDLDFIHANTNFSRAEREDWYIQARGLWTGKETQNAGIVLLEPGFHEFKLDSGAKLRIYATPFTPLPAGVDASEWGFGYKSNEDLYNPPGTEIWYSNPVGMEKTTISDDKRGEIDVLISHGPPRYRLDRSEEGESIGCPNLWRAVRRCRPRVHCFGHVHRGHGCEKIRWKVENGEPLSKDDDVEDGIAEVRRVAGNEIGAGDGDVKFVKVGKLGDRKEETLFVNAALMGEEGLEKLPWIVEIELDMVGSIQDGGHKRGGLVDAT